MPTRDDAWPQGTPCWVDCSVDDPVRARDFYSRLFGWEVVDSSPEAGGYQMAMLNDKPAAGIGPKMGDTSMPSVWTTYLAADDAGAVAAGISAAGGTVLTPPFEVMDAGRMCVAADPTGAVFAVWQSGLHTGAGIYNEPGAYCWNELHTNEYKQAQEFYSTVFDWSFTEIGDRPNFTYSTFANPDSIEPIGGLMDSSTMPNPTPPHWLTWFRASGTDEALVTARELGAAVLLGPDDSPFGRMGIVQGPQGEVFGVIDTAVTVGEQPIR